MAKNYKYQWEWNSILRQNMYISTCENKKIKRRWNSLVIRHKGLEKKVIRHKGLEKKSD